MKNKILITTLLVVIMLTASSLASANNITLNDQNTTIKINEKENKSDGDESKCIKIATLHVKVLDRYGNPCPDAKVSYFRWLGLGLLLLPVFFGILQLPITLLKSKYSDENGNCTFNIMLFISSSGVYGWFPFTIHAYKDGLSRGKLIQLDPGDNNVTISFKNYHGND